MTYLVLFEGDTADWRLSQRSLEQALLHDWADRITLASSSGNFGGPTGELIELFSTRDSQLEAWLDPSGECLYLDDGMEDAATFAAWYRGLIPADVEVTSATSTIRLAR